LPRKLDTYLRVSGLTARDLRTGNAPIKMCRLFWETRRTFIGIIRNEAFDQRQAEQENRFAAEVAL
jgi:hypothetical protein